MGMIRKCFDDHRATWLARVALYCLVLIATLSCWASAQGSTEARIRALRYPAGYDVRTHERRDAGTFTVSFLTRLTYPSLAVLEFYDRELQRLGWIQFAESGYEQSYRKWDCFEDLAGLGYPFVHQLQAKWVNQDKSRMLLLAIRYHSSKVERKGVPCAVPDNDTPHVYVQLMPFVPLPG